VAKRCTRWKASRIASDMMPSVIRTHAEEAEMPEQDQHRAQHDHQAERLQGEREGRLAIGHGQSVDQLAGIERQPSTSARGREQHAEADPARQQRPRAANG